jgi:excisionase family DNA binding protein
MEVPIWEKLNLTIEEAAKYSGIGINRLRDIVAQPSCPFVLHIGTKKLIKRKLFEKYLESATVL